MATLRQQDDGYMLLWKLQKKNYKVDKQVQSKTVLLKMQNTSIKSSVYILSLLQMYSTSSTVQSQTELVNLFFLYWNFRFTLTQPACLHILYCSCIINPLNTELNPICHLLALLGAHHILHVSRIRVNRLSRSLTARSCTIQSLP